MGQRIARYWSKLTKQSFPLALTLQYAIVHISANDIIRQALHYNASHDAALLHATLPPSDKGFLLQFFIAFGQRFLLILATIRNDNRFLG